MNDPTPGELYYIKPVFMGTDFVGYYPILSFGKYCKLIKRDTIIMYLGKCEYNHFESWEKILFINEIILVSSLQAKFINI